MSMNKDDDSLDLELWFSASRKHTPDPSEDLLARVLADAAMLQPEAPGIVTAAPEPEPRPSIWQQFTNAIGGWSGLAGLGTATVAGLWIGLSAPNTLVNLGSGYSADESGFEPTYLTELEDYALLVIEEGAE